MKFYKAFCDKSEKIMYYICGYLLILISILTFTNAVVRNVAGDNLTWVDESTRYMMVWLTFMVGAIAVGNQSHTTVDIFPTFLKEKLPKFDYSILINTFILICMGVFFYYTLLMVLESIEIGNKSVVLGIPMSAMFASTVVCAFFSILYCIKNIALAVIGLKEKNSKKSEGDVK